MKRAVNTKGRLSLDFGRDQLRRAQTAMLVVDDGPVGVGAYRDAVAVGMFCAMQAVANIGMLSQCPEAGTSPTAIAEATLLWPVAMDLRRRSRLAAAASSSVVGTMEELNDRGLEIFTASNAWLIGTPGAPSEPYAWVKLKIALARALLADRRSLVRAELAAALAPLLGARRHGPDLAGCIASLGFARMTARVLPESNRARVAAEAQLDALDALATAALAEQNGWSSSAAGRAISIAKLAATGACLVRVELDEPDVHALIEHTPPTVRRVLALVGVLARPVVGVAYLAQFGRGDRPRG